MEGKYQMYKACEEMGIEGFIYIDYHLKETKGPTSFKSEVLESKGW